MCLLFLCFRALRGPDVQMAFWQNRSISLVDMYIDNSEPTETVGQIHFSLEYDFQNTTLILKIMQVSFFNSYLFLLLFKDANQLFLLMMNSIAILRRRISISSRATRLLLFFFVSLSRWRTTLSLSVEEDEMQTSASSIVATLKWRASSQKMCWARTI